MDLSWIEFSLLVILFLGIYKYLTKNDRVFEKRGVPFLKPTFLLGNLGSLITGRENGFEFFQNKYDMFKDDKLVKFCTFGGAYKKLQHFI